MSHDRFNLQRFVDAQQPVYEQVLAELRAGRKRSHWMWFIFPQLAGLGHSEMARRFAVSCLEEAKDFLEHPVLGKRLRECTECVNAIRSQSVAETFGHPDDMKFHSSMTLFAAAADDNGVFADALTHFFGGRHDPLTVARLRE